MVSYEKLDVALVMAFNVGDDLFEVIINGSDVKLLSKEEILELSENEEIISIELNKRIGERRWRNR